MPVAKCGNRLAIRLPAAVVDVPGLKEGDNAGVRVANDGDFELQRTATHQEILARRREFRRRLPADVKFDRLQADSRDDNRHDSRSG